MGRLPNRRERPQPGCRRSYVCVSFLVGWGAAAHAVVTGAGLATYIATFADVTPPPNAAPTITYPSPVPGTTTRDLTPTIRATVRDDLTDLRKSNLKLYVDGRRVTNFSYDTATNRLGYASQKLSLGWHVVRVEAVDAQGKERSRRWAFKVDRR